MIIQVLLKMRNIGIYLTQLLMINPLRLIRIVLLILPMIGLSGCCGSVLRNCPAYVTTYMDIKAISLEATSSRIVINVRPVQTDRAKRYTFLMDGKDAFKYESLCRKHNDLSYNQKVGVINNVDFSGSCYISEDFTEITVTSDKDFDENHPAGESLNDLCRFISFSPYKFISSGYRDYYVFTVNNVSLSFVNYAGKFIGNSVGTINGQKLTCHPIDKMLSDVTPEDLILLGYDSPYPLFRLCFEKTPSTPGGHLITVRMRTDSDKIFSDSIAMSF